MLKPSIPHDEQFRLESLRALKLLDSYPAERFDRVTRLAKRLFDVPIALISLVDADRQWFLSAFGVSAKETPRDISICGHAILGDEILTIPNTTLDPRFEDNPLVTGDFNIRFYAGCPIKVENGSKLGTLCLIDRTPREFSEEDKALLQDLTQMIEREVVAIQLATLDELTLISNRRGFEVLAEHVLDLCKRMNKPAALIFLDLDKFKQINDDFGHAEGDRVLQMFSHFLRDSFRESDVIGRLGGDEFAILLANSHTDESNHALARLEVLVNRFNRENILYKLEYSSGCVCFDLDKHQTIKDMLKEGDALMYHDKKRT